MNRYLGIDTSNYRTSVGVYSSDEIRNMNCLIPVAKGAVGIRQSDAVFHHTKQLLPFLEEAFCHDINYDAIGVSSRPRPLDGSYMPCFLVGQSFGRAIALAKGIPVYEFSHQEGHIMAALFGSDSQDLIGQPFLAWHVSGGTTECQLCTPASNGLFHLELVASSLDLKAGQAIDRVGNLLGLPFPAGESLEQLSLSHDKTWKNRPYEKDFDFSLSGIQNQAENLLSKGETPQNIAWFCMESICAAIVSSTEKLLCAHGDLPVLCCGGVMSNEHLTTTMKSKFDARICPPQLSGDNAVGTALLAKYVHEHGGATL